MHKIYLILVTFFVFTSCSLAQEKSPETVVYREANDVALKAYIFKPATPGKNRPAILFFHGGGWRIGEPAWTFYRAKEFADHGMVAICIQYRLANDGLTPADGVEDACAAFAWARTHAVELGIDPKRVAGYGLSAGGHLVTSAALLPAVRGKAIGPECRPNVMLLYSPALNMKDDGYFIDLMNGKDKPADYSPAQFVTGKCPPTLIIQGEKDNIVLTSHAQAFHDDAVKAGAKCTLLVYPGVGHLLTRNLANQYTSFDPDAALALDGHQKEDDFLRSLGYFPE